MVVVHVVRLADDYPCAYGDFALRVELFEASPGLFWDGVIISDWFLLIFLFPGIFNRHMLWQ